MADEDKTIVTEDKTPQTTPKEDKSSQESDQATWKELTGGKFKSAEELAKSYSELEKKFGSQSDEVRQGKEFVQAITPLLEEIKNDPILFKALDDRLSKKGQSSGNSTKDNAKGEEVQGDVRQVTSDLLLGEFERKYGIDKMEPDEARDLRQKIGDAISELTGKTLGDVDLRRLSNTLENAYIIAKYKSKSAVPDSETAEDRASISSVPSKGGKGETVLTPEEARVAEKLGLTRDQYIRGKK